MRSLNLLGLGAGWFIFVLVFLRLYLDDGRRTALRDGAMPAEFWVWASIGLACAIALFLGAFLLLRRARMFEDMPTSRIRSAAQGYVEIEGHVRLLPGPPIVSPLSRQYCVWWSYTIRRYDTHDRRWQLIESATSDSLFELVDDTGTCIVDPQGAQVTPGLSRRWRGESRLPGLVPQKSPWISFGRYAYSEQMIRSGEPVYAIGQFRTQTAIMGMDEARDASQLLSEWKRDQRELLQRFDVNGDGRVDLQEWETARREALQQVRRQQFEESLHPDIHVLCRPRDRRPFILSTGSQQQLVRRYRFGAALSLLASLLLGAILLSLLGHQTPP